MPVLPVVVPLLGGASKGPSTGAGLRYRTGSDNAGCRGDRTASSSLRGGALQQQTHAGADVYMYSVKHAKRQRVSRYIDSSENHHRLAHVDGCRDNVVSIIAS